MLKGVNLTPEVREKFAAGKTVYLKDMVDSEGKLFSSYVRPNFGLGKFEFFKWNPDKKQKQEQSQGETRRKQDQPVARKQAARKAGKKGMGI